MDLWSVAAVEFQFSGQNQHVHERLARKKNLKLRHILELPKLLDKLHTVRSKGSMGPPTLPF